MTADDRWHSKSHGCHQLFIILASLAIGICPTIAVEPDRLLGENPSLFRRENLVAWCIVPFDAKRRGPEERAAMLERLGFKHFAYDYRAEHVPTFDAEIEACRRHGVSLDAWWFPGSLNDEARRILEICRKHDIHPQLWITGSGGPTADAAEQARRVEQEANRIRPIAEAAAAQGMKVGLYNHGGWFGEPENQLAIIKQLNLPNVGIVYNFHHGHDHVDRLAEILRKTLPHLLAVNINGMNRQGDRRGQKILQLGQGELDLELLRIVRDSGYRGPIGILGHTQDDAEARLQDNLDGLDWLLPQLAGKPAGAKPKPRTPVPGSRDPAATGAAAPAGRPGYLADGRREYTATPLTIELRATLKGKQSYNILAACETKASPRHWEIFTMPGSGALTAYLPGRKPDHVHTTIDLCDGRPRDVAMIYEADRVRLFADGQLAADVAIESPAAAGGDQPPPQGLAVGRLVEGTIGSNGTIDELWIARGVHRPHTPEKNGHVIGQWIFGPADAPQVADLSPLKNPLRRTTQTTAAPPSKAPTPAPGVHLKPVDPKLKVTLIDRSADDVYMGVKVDDRGQVFVGGREAVFVFEPSSDGKFTRRELLRFPQDSIIMGLEFRGDDLLVLTSNALYELPEGRTRREGLTARRVLWGLPLDLHVSFHCLAWGTDGHLYLTHGDPLLNFGDWQRPDHWGHWTLFSKPLAPQPKDKEGRLTRIPERPQPSPFARDADGWLRTPFTGQGAVLRMNVLDGSISVVASGLRGPVGLAFDTAGNLFTNDNDHESRADQYAPARLLHVIDGVDFAWPRGWAASKSPDRFDLIEPMCDLGRGVPCDLTYCGTGVLGDSLKDQLLQCRWDRHSVTAYRPTARGISFSTVEQTVFTGDDNCRPVGIAVDPRGSLFVTAVYMTGNMAAPYCASDLMMVTYDEESPRVNPRIEDEPKKIEILQTAHEEARSADDYLRQRGAIQMAREYAVEDFVDIFNSDDEASRLAAVLGVGRRLTVPDVHFVPPAELELSYPQESAFFKRSQPFVDLPQKIDLADFGRIGSFTIAAWWKAAKHTPDQEQLFALLQRALNDSSDRVRLQSAYFLALLNDERSEPQVVQTRRDVQLRRLAAAPKYFVNEVWTIGPIDDTDSAAERPDPQRLDLSASFGDQKWQRFRMIASSAPALKIKAPASSTYRYFRVASGSRQTALLTLDHRGPAAVWLNGTVINDRVSDDAAGGEHSFFVDLQPGGNDFVLHLTTPANTALHSMNYRLQSPVKLEVSLPEALDSAQLAARLREAAAGGVSQPLDPAFVSTDWPTAAAAGDAAAGRRLFGTLGCAKCHAVAPDQKSAGAPSLFEAKRRFTVPHLVESVLLPSRQVAEPFRGQIFALADGRELMGLVTSEGSETIELLLPDATRKTVVKRDVEERRTSPVSPMPQGLVKTPAELRDLLAYLLSDRPLPP